MLDETVETRLPWLDFSLSRHPCQAISVLHEHNSTVSRQLRYSLSRDCVSPHHAHKPHFPIKNISISSATHHLTSLHNITRRKHRPPVRTRHPNLTTTQQDVSTGHRCAHVTPHILPQRKGRKRRGRRAHVLLRERIAKLPSVCRIMLRTTEMHRHGRRGKALCATDGA